VLRKEHHHEHETERGIAFRHILIPFGLAAAHPRIRESLRAGKPRNSFGGKGVRRREALPSARWRSSSLLSVDSIGLADFERPGARTLRRSTWVLACFPFNTSARTMSAIWKPRTILVRE
jgi:hypothetical protein